MITCTFAGHREVFGACTQKIENALETLMENEDALCCYVGGMGEFDGFSAAAVRTKAGEKDNLAGTMKNRGAVPVIGSRAQNQIEAQRSGFDLERSRDKMSER